MPITELEPDVALIVVDLQSGSRHGPSVHPFDDVVSNAAALADAFRARNRPVVLANVTGVAPGRTERPIDVGALPDGFADLLPELHEQPGDITVTRSNWDAFAGTGLANRLRSLGVTHVVIVGHATAFGVETTARSAYAHGFHVTLPTDAMTDFHPDAHERATQVIFPMLGETGTTADVLDRLEQGR